MDDEVHVIHQNPFPLPAALHRIRVGVKLPFHLHLNFVGDRYHLARIRSAGDEEKIGEA